MDKRTPFLQVLFWGGGREGILVSQTVTYVDVEDHDRLIDKATIVVDDPKGDLARFVDERTRVQVVMGWEGAKASLFEGIAYDATQEGSGGASGRVTVTALDFSYFLNQKASGQRKEHVGLLSKIIGDIVKKYPDLTIGKDKKKQDQILPDKDPEYKKDKPLAQRADQTDWSFIQQLAVENNCRAFVEYTLEDKEWKSRFYFVSVKRLYKADPQEMLHYCRSFSDVKELKVERVASGASPIFTVATIDDKKGDIKPGEKPEEPKTPPDKGAATPPPGLNQQQVAGFKAAANASAKAKGDRLDQAQRGFYASVASDPKLAENLVQRDPARAQGYLATGTTVGNVSIRAKGTIKIDGLAPWVSSNWYLARVNHIFRRTGTGRDERVTYETKFWATQ